MIACARSLERALRRAVQLDQEILRAHEVTARRCRTQAVTLEYPCAVDVSVAGARGIELLPSMDEALRVLGQTLRNPLGFVTAAEQQRAEQKQCGEYDVADHGNFLDPRERCFWAPTDTCVDPLPWA